MRTCIDLMGCCPWYKYAERRPRVEIAAQMGNDCAAASFLLRPLAAMADDLRVAAG